MSTGLRERVVGFDGRPEPVALNMGVDLRRRDVGMTQHLLHRPEVCAARQKVASESMPEDVGRYPVRVEACLGRQQFELEREMLPGQVSLLAIRRK